MTRAATRAHPRQRDYPKTVTIKGQTWRVSWHRKLWHEEHGACRGLCIYTTRQIKIRQAMSPAGRAEIFWHEILHALSYEYGYTMAHPAIYNLQGPLAEILRDNPSLSRPTER